MSKEGRTKFTLEMPNIYADELKERAKQEGCSIAQLIEEALHEYFQAIELEEMESVKRTYPFKRDDDSGVH